MNKISENVFKCNSVNQMLLNGSCKIMSGQNGGGFYARYRFDRNRGTGFIELIIEYPEGTVVPIPLCKNVCKLADDENEGIVSADYILPKELHFTSLSVPQKGKKWKQVVPEVKESLQYTTDLDYGLFIKYERPDFKVPMRIIWKKIIEHWNDLPVVGWSKEFSMDDIYQELLLVGENRAEVDNRFNDSLAVYLTRGEIEDVAYDYGVEFNFVRRFFEARELWMKDKGTLGYQFSKKVNGKVERFYKLRKISMITSVNINEKFCIEYCEK